MDHIRPQDVSIFQVNGADWVKATVGDEVSTSETAQSHGKWHHLLKGTPFAF